jgi:hypothetical protein
LQVNNLIVTLYTSSSRQQLPHTQQQHAQQQQTPHAQQHKSRREKGGKQLQLQPQHANSQDKVSEGLQGTALLASQHFDCNSVHIGIASAAPEHSSNSRSNHKPHTPSSTKHAEKIGETTATAGSARQLTRTRSERPAGNCTPCKSTI